MSRQAAPPGPADEAGRPTERHENLGNAGAGYGSTWDQRDRPDHKPSMAAKLKSKLANVADFQAARKLEQLKNSKAANLASFVFLPWVFFAVVMAPFALGLRHYETLAWFIFALALAVCLAIFTRGRSYPQAESILRSYYTQLSLLCTGATVLALFLGLYTYFRYIALFHVYEASRYYHNVLPSQAPSEFQDAGMFTFSTDSFVDPTRSVGFKAVGRYCAAPILNTATARAVTPGVGPRANFWAVGMDCCNSQGSFDCGPIWDPTAHSGLRVLDASPLKTEDRPFYMGAVREAAAVFNLRAPENAILVKWTKHPEALPKAYWHDGVRFYRRMVGIYIAVVMALGLFTALYSDIRSVRYPTY